jgi:hypothetical protein
LPQDRFVGDLGIRGQQECFAENNRQGIVSIERKVEWAALTGAAAPAGHNAQIVASRLSEDVGARYVNIERANRGLSRITQTVAGCPSAEEKIQLLQPAINKLSDEAVTLLATLTDKATTTGEA